MACVSFSRMARQPNLRARRLQHSEAGRASWAGCAQAEELGILAALLASRCFVGPRTAVSSRPSMRLCKTSGPSVVHQKLPLAHYGLANPSAPGNESWLSMLICHCHTEPNARADVGVSFPCLSCDVRKLGCQDAVLETSDKGGRDATMKGDVFLLGEEGRGEMCALQGTSSSRHR